MKTDKPSFEQNGGAAHSLSGQKFNDNDPTLDIQQEINQLEEIVMDGFNIPLTGVTILNEEKLVRQIDVIRQKLPKQVQEAIDIILKKDLIISEAEDSARHIIDSAQKRANQILNETGIIQQAEREAHQLMHRIQQECEALQLHTLSEVEKMRSSAQKEVADLQHKAIHESEMIYKGADDYADDVLNHLQQNLQEMLRIVENGRRQRSSDNNHYR